MRKGQTLIHHCDGKLSEINFEISDPAGAESITGVGVCAREPQTANLTPVDIHFRSTANSVKVVEKPQSCEKYSCWCLLRPVGADQSEQIGLLGRTALKRQELKQAFRQS